MWKQALASWFSFTKKERTGIFILLFLIAFFVLLPFLYPFFMSTKPMDTAAFEKDIAMLKIKQADTSARFAAKNYDDNEPSYYVSGEKNYPEKKSRGELFYFDPNTASFADWQRLGVRDKTISTIQKYLSKGGHFYKPEDISKIWGLHPDEVQRMMPYVQIAGKENLYPSKDYERKIDEHVKAVPSIIDINTADTSAFIALPGIGSKLAQRIINFRDKLGGFYTTEQVKETFGLPDSTFQKVKARLAINDRKVKQLNINVATIDEMKAHPYLRYTIANAIIQYRAQHGNFAAVDDIKKIMLVTDELYNKIAPYLSIQ